MTIFALFLQSKELLQVFHFLRFYVNKVITWFVSIFLLFLQLIICNWSVMVIYLIGIKMY